MNGNHQVRNYLTQLASADYSLRDNQQPVRASSPISVQCARHADSAATGGAMTYRVVHINAASGSGGAGVVQTLSDATSTGLLNSSIADNGQMAAYIASGSGADALSSASGFYVIGGTSADLLGGSSGGGGVAARLRGELPRDDRRRATHNEVERRRRDKINNWITKLAKILPDSSGNGDLAKSNLSKGAVLAQACDFIAESRNYHAKYVDAARENEKLHEDIKMLKQSNEALVTANQLLKAHLKSQGAIILESDSSASH